MVEDDKGFRYPQIDYSRCNKCGLCDRVCAFNEHYKGYGNHPSIYAVKNKDEAVRNTSSSGGMFTAISDKILEDGGIVYGAGYKDRLYVCHKRATTKEQRDEFKGSKYVQSDIGRSFIRAKQDLDNDLKVLFTGTPCQVSALRSFLQKDYENLLTVDFVCHGTPSNKLWQDYLDVIEKDTRNKVVDADFRDKDKGWRAQKTKLHFQDKQTTKIKGEQSFFYLFVYNFMLMPSCHNCKYTNFNRVGDITVADFWGIEQIMPGFNDDTGISLVLVNSDKGAALLESIKNGLEIRTSGQQDCFLQKNLKCASLKHNASDQFWNDYHKRGMRYVVIKYTDYGILGTFIKKVIRKIKSMKASYTRQD